MKMPVEEEEEPYLKTFYAPYSRCRSLWPKRIEKEPLYNYFSHVLFLAGFLGVLPRQQCSTTIVNSHGGTSTSSDAELVIEEGVRTMDLTNTPPQE